MDDQTSDRSPSLTSHAARRRRVLAGVLAGAALAVPGVAFAAGGASGDGAAAPASTPPTLSVQDEGGSGTDRDGDGRDCPEEERGGASGGSGSQAPSSGGTSEQTAL